MEEQISALIMAIALETKTHGSARNECSPRTFWCLADRWQSIDHERVCSNCLKESEQDQSVQCLKQTNVHYWNGPDFDKAQSGNNSSVGIEQKHLDSRLVACSAGSNSSNSTQCFT